MTEKLSSELDGSFEAQCDRIKKLVEGGCVTPELGSLMLSYYAMGRYESTGEQCDAGGFAKAHFNPLHDESMLAYRMARPANIALY